METEVKKEQKYLPVLLAVLVMLFVTVGAVAGAWYYMDQQAKQTADDNKKQTEELQKQIDDLKEAENTTTTNEKTSNLKTYSNTALGVSLKYPDVYQIEDKTNIWTGNDINNFPWYRQSSFAKALLMLNINGVNDITMQISETIDMDKALGSLGGGSPYKTVVQYGDYSGYVATQYGQAEGSPNIVYTLVGPKYSIALMSLTNADSGTLKNIISSVKFN